MARNYGSWTTTLGAEPDAGEIEKDGYTRTKYENDCTHTKGLSMKDGYYTRTKYANNCTFTRVILLEFQIHFLFSFFIDLDFLFSAGKTASTNNCSCGVSSPQKGCYTHKDFLMGWCIYTAFVHPALSNNFSTLDVFRCLENK